MSYQIKSTPFFRRMVSTSKKNGQLQRLKEEYERIKEFNDRTIEMKMRQVRLKRLFREIEEIKETSSQWKRARNNERPKTDEELRLETLIKAKELGKEYSKMNALVDRCSPRVESVASGGSVNQKINSKVDIYRKELSEKRINYGNQSSRSNIQKFVSTPRKPPAKVEDKDEKTRKEMTQRLKERLTYGNTSSSRNLAKVPKKNAPNKLPSEGSQMSPSLSRKSSQQNAGNIVETFVKFEPQTLYIPKPLPNKTQKEKDEEASEAADDAEATSSYQAQLYRSFQELQNSRAQVVRQVAGEQPKSEEDPQTRALRRWRKLALLVRHQFDSNRRRQLKQSMQNADNVVPDEFKLRFISNDGNQSINPLDSRAPESDDDQQSEEAFMAAEDLCKSSSSTMTPHTAEAMESLSDSDEMRYTMQQYQEYLRLIKPIVRDAAQKEVMEYGDKFRAILDAQKSE